MCVCVSVSRDLGTAEGTRRFLKSLGGPASQPTFCMWRHQTVVIIKRHPPQPQDWDYLAASCRCERLNNSPSVFWHALLWVLRSTPDPEKKKKHWHLNEIIHLLVWCHPEIAIIAGAWRRLVCDWQRHQNWARCARAADWEDAPCWSCGDSLDMQNRQGAALFFGLDQHIYILLHAQTTARRNLMWSDAERSNERLSDAAAGTQCSSWDALECSYATI